MNDHATSNEGALFQTMDAPSTSALEVVRVGIAVEDATGDDVGTVEYVKMGDRSAATARGSITPGDSDFVRIGLEALAGEEPDVPEPKRSQLLRYGFIKVDGSGLTDTDRYVRGDKVRDVVDETVRLKVRKDQLLAED